MLICLPPFQVQGLCSGNSPSSWAQWAPQARGQIDIPRLLLNHETQCKDYCFSSASCPLSSLWKELNHWGGHHQRCTLTSHFATEWPSSTKPHSAWAHPLGALPSWGSCLWNSLGVFLLQGARQHRHAPAVQSQLGWPEGCACLIYS